MNQPSRSSLTDSPTLFGHPAGLFTLFFAEMWERFSYYGMRALLVFYMTKGFLGYGDKDAYAIYGAYTALVYMTPFFGGLLADRLLGQRRAVILGGLLMALGQLLMVVDWNITITIGGHSILLVERHTAFFTALALLICGNGFFKPNISTIVGSLYGHGNPRRDGGFTIFYMGVNLGAAIAPLLCGYLGETYSWRLGFGLATVGMLVGTAIFVAPRAATQILIFLTTVGAAGAMLIYHPANFLSVGMNVFVAAALCVSGIVAILALGRGGVPREAGAPPDPQYLTEPVLGPVNRAWMVHLGSILAIVIFMLLVSGFAPLNNWRPISLISEATLNRIESSDSPAVRSLGVIAKEVSRPANVILYLVGVVALVYLVFETVRLQRIARHRMYVVLILTFFSMVFWTFFEQAGSSINNFTDRNVDRVVGATRVISAEDVGKTITIEPTQKQLGYTWNGCVAVAEDDVDKTISVLPTEKQVGYHNGDEVFSAETLARIRTEHAGNPDFEIDWVVTRDDVGMQYQRRVFTIDVLNKLRRKQGGSQLQDRLARGEAKHRHGNGPPQRRDPCQRVPVGEFGLHSRLRSGLYRVLGFPGRAGPGTEHACQVLGGVVAVGAGVCRAVVRCPFGRLAWHGGHGLAVPDLLIAHDGRALPVAGRAVDDYEAVAPALGEHDDGRVVPGNRVFAVPGRHRGAVHRRDQGRQHIGAASQ